MIDIHTHILPGLDDGSQTLSDSLEMAELALESGVDTIIATPHSNQLGRFENFDLVHLKHVFSRLQQALQEEGIPLTLHLGMEIFASEDLCEKIQAGALLSLNRSRYYLVEFAFDEAPEFIGDILDGMLSVGAIPVIAHPERYFCVQDYPSLIYHWLQLGCFTQLNKGSIFGKFGRHAQIAADYLLRYRLATCIASDAHSPVMRTTHMRDIIEYLLETYGECEMLRLLFENPDRMIYDRDIPHHGSLPERRRGLFF